MEPITAITTAIVAGAVSASKETASNVIKDAYCALKARLTGASAANKEDVEQKIADLQKAIAELQSSISEQVKELPESELQSMATEAGEVGKQIIIENNKGVQVGNNNQQTNNFS